MVWGVTSVTRRPPILWTTWTQRHVLQLSSVVARLQECVLYDLLARLYDGEAARARR